MVVDVVVVAVLGVQRARERLTRQANKRSTRTARVVSGFVGRADANSGARCLRKSRFRSNCAGEPATGQGGLRGGGRVRCHTVAGGGFLGLVPVWLLWDPWSCASGAEQRGAWQNCGMGIVETREVEPPGRGRGMRHGMGREKGSNVLGHGRGRAWNHGGLHGGGGVDCVERD